MDSALRSSLPALTRIAASEPALPDRWSAEVEPQLAADEKIQAWLEIDLDARLNFAAGLVIVTGTALSTGLVKVRWLERRG